MPVGAVKANSTLLGKAFAVLICAKRALNPAPLLPKNFEAEPTSNASMSITGRFLGKTVKIGTEVTTRSVNKRFTEARDSKSPVERTLKFGSIINNCLSSRLK